MDKKYKGMTVNERLYISGLSQQFDNAVRDKNIPEIIAVLKKVEILDEKLINAILEQQGIGENR